MATTSIQPGALDRSVVGEAINRFGSICESEWLGSRDAEGYSSEFLEHGFRVFDIPPDLADRIAGYFDEANIAPLRIDDGRDDYICAAFTPAIVTSMNEQNTYFATPGDDVVEALDTFFGSISEAVEEELAHPWRITNVRAFGVRAGADYGANSWHIDGGLSRYLRKILVYTSPPCEENGTIELVSRTGDMVKLERSGPVALLADVSTLAHRGRPPMSGFRPTIEVTIVPSRETSSNCVFAGQLSRVPKDCAGPLAEDLARSRHVPQPASFEKRLKLGATALVRAPLSFLKKNSRKTKRDRALPAVTNLAENVNLGGGRKFKYKGWVNLEASPGVDNPFPFHLSPDCVVPVPTSSAGLVFSSHCFEHLDDETVARLLDESRRVLRGDGRLLLKLPDFDVALKCWKANDRSYFFDVWRLQKVTVTWGVKGVEDNIDSRAAYIFCGFWNAAFGHNFLGHKGKKLGPTAYNGPPVQIAEMAEDLKRLDSPHEIAVALRDAVKASETDYTFNHQNSWSRGELTALLADHGFEVTSFDADEILDTCAHVPRLGKSRDISFYCLAKPVRSN